MIQHNILVPCTFFLSSGVRSFGIDSPDLVLLVARLIPTASVALKTFSRLVHARWPLISYGILCRLILFFCVGPCS